MSKKPKDKQSQILAQLILLNDKIEKQRSFKSVFTTGIIYGIGFFVGSAILATISLGILGPYIAKITWISETYTRGTELK